QHVAGVVGQAERAAYHARQRLGEQEAAAALRVFPFHHLQLGVDALGAEPGDSLVLAADGIDQLVGERLAAGEDRAVGQRQNLRPRHRAAFGDDADEPVVAVEDELAYHGALFVGRRVEGRGLGLERRGFYLFELYPDLVHQAGDVGELDQHTDRTDDRGLAGDDMVGGAGDHIAGGSGERAHLRRHRLFGGQLADLLVDHLAAGGGAAGGVDLQDNALYVRGHSDFFQP